ncbi:DUF4190 domain-containing protein [Kitasatospora sp. NPDC097643]|uniref:DUF4190 domain-containing protein n=1 Tax=Kitasatospora sp. NPDC097643 TaxID=3157230 RepID=UPI0033331513
MSKPESEVPVPGPESPARTVVADPVDPREAVEAARRVDLDKPKTPTGGAPTDAAPAGTAPANPWAAPDLAAPPAAPAGPVGPPVAPPPSLAPPAPPHPLPAGGWASVPPAAQSGFQPGHPYPPGPAPTNGFAVGSLVTGLVLVAPVALVFGIVALVQINRRKERGLGMAVTGLVLGVIGSLLLALGLIGAVVAPSASDRPGRAPKAPAGSVAWSALKSGDCYNTPDGGSRTDPEGGDETLYWVRRVPCSAAHHGEVAGTARIPESDGPSYPGETQVRERAAELCRRVLDEYALDQWAIPDGMDDVYLYPTPGNWKSGERYVTCAFEDRDAQHRGTVRTDRGSLNSAQLAYLEAVRGFNSAYASQPKKEFAVAPSLHRDWARQMATASHAEAEALTKAANLWPAEVAPKVAELAAAQQEAATAWDTAAAGTDLEADIRRARALVGKTGPMSVEIRRALNLSTGEQVPDLRV